MTSVALVVSPPGPVRDGLAACIRQLDGAYSLRFLESADVSACKPGLSPRIVVLDLEAPQAQGATTVRTFAECFPRSTLIAVSEAIDPHTVEIALRSGALVYLPKGYTQRQQELVIRLALEGAGHRPYFPDESRAKAAEVQSAQRRTAVATPEHHQDSLTPKQVEVLSYLAAGLSNRQIASQLGIAQGTVKLHVTEILRKLHVEGRARAIVLARRMKEIQEQQVQQGQRGDLVLDWLLPHVSHRHLWQGEILFHKGDPGRELFYVQRGTVTLVEIGEEMGSGQIFGEIGVFAPERARTCTARCKTDVDLFCLDSEQVKSIYYLNPQFGLHIVTLLAQRLVAERMH